MALGYWLLKIDSEHIYSGIHDPRRFLPDIGLFLVFLSFTFFIVFSAFLSRKLKSSTSILGGIAALVASRIIWKLLESTFNVHSWTFVLVFIPLLFFLCGAILVVIGVLRWAISRFRGPAMKS